MKSKTLKIKFVGKGEAPAFITDGVTRIELPADQTKPFSHRDADRILKVAREQYKQVVQKGRKVMRSAQDGRFVTRQFAAGNPATTVSDSV